jgi:hypothetical protein
LEEKLPMPVWVSYTMAFRCSVGGVAQATAENADATPASRAAAADITTERLLTVMGGLYP